MLLLSIISAVLGATVAQKIGYAEHEDHPTYPSNQAYPSKIGTDYLSSYEKSRNPGYPKPSTGSIYSPPLTAETYVSPVSHSHSVSPSHSDPYSRGHGKTYSTHTSQTFVQKLDLKDSNQAFSSNTGPDYPSSYEKSRNPGYPKPPTGSIYSPPLTAETYVSPVSHSHSVSPPHSDPYSRGHGKTSYSTHTSQTFVQKLDLKDSNQAFSSNTGPDYPSSYEKSRNPGYPKPSTGSIYSPPLTVETYVSPVSHSHSVSPPHSDPYSRGHGKTYSTHTSQTFVASVYPEIIRQRYN